MAIGAGPERAVGPPEGAGQDGRVLRLAKGDDRLAVGVNRQGGDNSGTLGDRDDLVATRPEADHLAIVESEEQRRA